MRTRRHTGGLGLDLDFSAGSPGRRFARDLGLVLLTAIVGYAISAYWVAPAGAFASESAVPRVLELPQEDARERLTDLGFRVRVEGERPNPAIPRGAVVWQDPPPGTVIPPNSPVELVVSGGPAPVNVPDVVGLSISHAEAILEAAGMKVGRVDTVRSGQEGGVVLAVRPPPGNGLAPGSSVGLLVSGSQGEAE